jgi:anti-anti-sigma factor
VAAPPLPFSVSLIPDRDRLVMELRGELDIATSPLLAAALAECQKDGWRHVTLDLRNVDFMDSAAVHAILDAQNAAPDRRLQVIEGPGVSRIIALTRLSDVVAVLPADRW